MRIEQVRTNFKFITLFNSGKMEKGSMAVLKSNPKKNVEKQRINYETVRLYLRDRWNKVRDVLFVKSKVVGRDYFESSTINCYQYIVDDTMENWERFIWWTVHLTAIITAVFVMWVGGSDAILSPVAVTRAPTEAPVSSVPHPAIAICTLNRISKRRATNLARSLINTKQLPYAVSDIVTLLSQLGSVYDLELPKSNELEMLHGLLKPYNLGLLMQMLTPSCGEVLKRCLWHNEPIDCNSIFQMRKTSEGYCCTFNYQRGSDVVDSNSTDTIDEDQLNAMPGLERGLSILMDPLLDDYLYTRLPHEGFKIMIFNPRDYPDIQSGSCVQLNQSPLTELYVTLDVIHVSGSESVKKLDSTSRGCLFDSEITNFRDSLSDCILNCRIKNIKKICGCIPFFLPSKTDHEVCDLTDILCLNRWKDIWREIWSDEEFLLDNGEIDLDAPIPPCNNCLPPCEEETYRAFQHAIVLQPESLNSQPDSEKSTIKKSVRFLNHCVLHIFFSRDTVLHLEYSVLSSWYDLLSTMGGLCGLVLGASLISIVEIIYYMMGGPVSRPNKRRQPDMRQLYWQELRNYRSK